MAVYGYLVTALTDLGNGPLFAVQDGLQRRLGWSLGVTATVLGLGMACTGALLGGRVGVGTVVTGATVGHLFAFWRRVLDRFVRSSSSAHVDGNTRGDSERGTDEPGLFASGRCYPAPELSTITPRTTSATPATFDPVSDSS